MNVLFPTVANYRSKQYPRHDVCVLIMDRLKAFTSPRRFTVAVDPLPVAAYYAYALAPNRRGH